MSRYANMVVNNNWSGYSLMRQTKERYLFNIGDRVTLKQEFKTTIYYQLLGDKTYQIDEIRPVTSWKWLPFTQFLGLAGNSNDLYFNTIFKKS